MRTRLLLASLPLFFACGGGADAPPPVDSTPAAPLLSAADQFYTRNGVRIRYRETGRGTPVVLIHGYAGRLEQMAGLADSLKDSARVVVLDVRGFGGSDSPDSATAYGLAMTDDVVGLLDHLGIQRAHLVGHSMGALIAADAADRYGSRVASVTLIGGPFYPDSATMTGRTRSYVAELRAGRGLVTFIKWIFPGIPDSLARGYNSEIMRSNDSLALIVAMEGMGGLVIDSTERAGAVAPALVAVGSLDPLLPHSRALAAWWPGAQLLEIEGADHVTIAMRPEVLAGIRRLVRGG